MCFSASRLCQDNGWPGREVVGRLTRSRNFMSSPPLSAGCHPACCMADRDAHLVGSPATTISACSRRSERSSPLTQGAGFEPSVPLEVLTVGIVPCRLRGPFHASLPKTKFAADSALEEGVSSEPVSEPKFPASWENTGNFRYYGASATAPTGQRRCEITT